MASSPRAVTSLIATRVNKPLLKDIYAESIGILLRPYIQYCNEATERAHQLNIEGYATTEHLRPVQLKFCVDAE